MYPLTVRMRTNVVVVAFPDKLCGTPSLLLLVLLIFTLIPPPILKSLVDAGKVSQLDVYEKFLSKIAEDDKVKTRGARISPRIRWAGEGEASTRFFSWP